MKELHVFDAKNYGENWNRYRREAVRAIIFKNDKLAMVKSETDGFYKFPGGGMKPDETQEETLIREAAEETGLRIIPQSVKEYGFVEELRKSAYNGHEIFNQKSYYYFADVYDGVLEKNLDNYEKDLGFHLEYVNLQTAFQVNSELSKNSKHTFLVREAYVLKLLIDGTQ